MGITTGVASPFCFRLPLLDINAIVHGDDFTAMGTAKDLDHREAELAKHFELKIRGRIGEGLDGPNEIRILNRCLRFIPNGLDYEADPRHADLLLDAFGLIDSTGIVMPGINEGYLDSEAEKSEDKDASDFSQACWCWIT